MYVQKEHYKPAQDQSVDYYDIHHRKPREQGGDNSNRNTSNVLRSKHNAWHALYEVLPVQLLISQFQNDCEIYGTWNPRSDLIQRLVEGYANSTKALIKRRIAWFTLFGGASLQNIITEINLTWIDPDYEIQIGTERILKTWSVYTPRQKVTKVSIKKLT